MVDLLRLFKVFQQHIPVWVIFKLFDQSRDRVFAICVHLFNNGVWYAWDSDIDVAAASYRSLLVGRFLSDGCVKVRHV